MFKNNLFFIFLYFLLSLIITLLIQFLSIYFSSTTILQKDLEKLTPYECGFNPYGSSKGQMEIDFVLLSLFFVVFDLEIVILVPWVLVLDSSNSISFFYMIEFLLELIVGYIYIYSLNKLNF